MRQFLSVVVVLGVVFTACREEEPDIDFVALDTARRACSRIQTAVEAAEDDPRSALIDAKEAYELAREAAGRDEVYTGVEVGIAAVYDALAERDASELAKWWAETRPTCLTVLRGREPTD